VVRSVNTVPCQHQQPLPDYVMKIIKLVFRDLSQAKQLMKSVHGRTQNPNESFNSCA
jgi:hypothetical protein